MPDLTSSKETVWSFLLDLLWQYMVYCVNGSFELAYSVNTDQTALTASLICDLPSQHYHLHAS